jgi:hypothetical protein
MSKIDGICNQKTGTSKISAEQFFNHFGFSVCKYSNAQIFKKIFSEKKSNFAKKFYNIFAKTNMKICFSQI